MNETYQKTGKDLSGYDVKKLIPKLKKQENTS
jgi:putative transposase